MIDLIIPPLLDHPPDGRILQAADHITVNPVTTVQSRRPHILRSTMSQIVQRMMTSLLTMIGVEMNSHRHTALHHSVKRILPLRWMILIPPSLMVWKRTISIMQRSNIHSIHRSRLRSTNTVNLSCPPPLSAPLLREQWKSDPHSACLSWRLQQTQRRWCNPKLANVRVNSYRPHRMHDSRCVGLV